LWAGPALQAHPARHLGTSQMGKNSLGGFTRKSLAARAAGLIPTGAGDLNGLAPAVLEAALRYMKTPPASFLELGFRPVRAIRGGLHLPQQIFITSALRRILGKWPWDVANLGEVRCANFGHARRSSKN
jgi:hypothetical protein